MRNVSRGGKVWGHLGRCACCLLFLLGCASASALTISAAVARDDGPPVAGAEAPRPAPDAFQPFDLRGAIGLAALKQGVWLRLQPDSAGWPAGVLGVLLRYPDLAPVSVYMDDQPIAQARLYGPRGNAAPLLSGLGFGLRLPVGSEHVPLYLHIAPQQAASPVRVVVDGYAAIERLDTHTMMLRFACLAALLLTMLTALIAGLLLRDRAYLWYLGYIGSCALWYVCVSGLPADSLADTAAVLDPLLPGLVMNWVSMMFVPLLAAEFCDFRRLVPRAQHAVPFAVAVFAAATLMGLSQYAQLWSQTPWMHALHGGLVLLLYIALVAVTLGFTGAAALALRRGNRYAGVFLLGWLPLYLGTVCATLGRFRGDSFDFWLPDTILVFVTWEALVLSLGLSVRALSVRIDRDHLRLMVRTDALTGLPNRRSGLNTLDALVHAAATARHPLAIVFIDIDHFKQINDMHGHSTGDAALRHCAAVMRASLRATDVLARLGGEEFLLVLPQVEVARAAAMAETLRARLIDFPLLIDGGSIALSASFGVAELEGAQDDADRLLARADRAMYEAKAAGRNCVVAAPPALVARLAQP